MKYNAPPGGEPDASYLDGNRNAGVKGSIVPAAAIEYPQRELAHLIDYAGLMPDNADLQQVRKAIEALISAATGGGDVSQFLLVSQARARLPIFPEILSADGKINVTSPAAGSVQVPSGVTIQHRGIYPFSTSVYDEAARTFATAASKTYHLRWTPTGGLALKDLADAGYNPSALAEGDVSFDTTYEDMLLARVVTSASNIATITNLINKDRLLAQQTNTGLVTINPYANEAKRSATLTWNWARRPLVSVVPVSFSVAQSAEFGGFQGSAVHDHDFSIQVASLTRYGASIEVMRDYANAIDFQATLWA